MIIYLKSRFEALRMPEIVEVEIIRKWLHDNHKDCIIRDSERYPEIIGTIIDNISRKGKQIFFKLVRSDKSVLYLDCRLGLKGKWSRTKENNTRFWLKLEKNITKNGVIESEEIILYNDDSINYGDVELFNEEKYKLKLSQLGADFLNDKIDPEEWKLKIRNNRLKNKQICDYLMEQKYYSGIGNYLKAEILYHAKIKPDRTLSTLSDQEIYTLLNSSLFIIIESYKYGGLTIKDFWSPEGEKGKYPKKVYNREKDENGYSVIVSTFKDKRKTYWVPEIQK